MAWQARALPQPLFCSVANLSKSLSVQSVVGLVVSRQCQVYSAVRRCVSGHCWGRSALDKDVVYINCAIKIWIGIPYVRFFVYSFDSLVFFSSSTFCGIEMLALFSMSKYWGCEPHRKTYLLDKLGVNWFVCFPLGPKWGKSCILHSTYGGSS